MLDQAITLQKNNISQQAKLPSIQTHYVFDYGIFGENDIRLLSKYKTFIENTIIELGEDWRIESTLLSEQISNIMNTQNMCDDSTKNLNIFNQFLLSFVSEKIGFERQIVDVAESKLQQGFTNKILLHFSQQKNITSSLTFKTLSLGFCITATDVWKQVFSVLHGNVNKNVNLAPFVSHIQRKVPSLTLKTTHKTYIESSNAQSISYQQINDDDVHKQNYQNFNTIAQVWKPICIQDITSRKQYKNIQHTLKRQLNHKTTVLGNFVFNMSKYGIKNGHIIVVSLSNTFYRLAFIIWLIFNIKAFFSLNFDQYLRYFKSLYKDWKGNLTNPLKNFYQLIQKEWNTLLKDYSVALNDDFQVLHKLVDRVRGKMIKNWQQKSEDLRKFILKNKQ